MAGDPDYETSREIVRGLPGAGVDIIELGMPFTDPMADGPTIQLAGQRALAAGQTLAQDAGYGAELRATDDDNADRDDGLLQPDPFARRRPVSGRRARRPGSTG